ncbi:hypothetical protein LB465_03035 [Salegentibacter sp. LM13S]|uniref:hypothetical protein n=1 Tax=Salegentibacter lacus TaxID=2873599 RepID=UPI001CCEB319|nr:hypothetical protein [Salegentibacter lacus]MBZ9629741.1 hypothetical protein [Salegentibacter lacus]
MKINKVGFYILNVILLSAIIIGQYEWIEPRTVISILIIAAFIISASLTYGVTKKTKRNE